MANNAIKITSLIYALIFSCNLFSGEHFSIFGNLIVFDRNEQGILINADCRKCLAMKSLDKLKQEKLKVDDKYKINGANIGALQCEINLGGEIVTGVNQKFKNRRLKFCLFKDGSMIHARALTQ